MATESPNSQNPVVEHDATHTEVAEIKATNDAAEISFPPRSESVREEQVQNAVKFLSHPKVRGSPIIYRRSFLEKKGLTKEEIDEAFRLVPDPSPSVPSVVPITNQASVQSTSLQSQPATQSLQLAGAPVSSTSMAPGLQEPRFRLSQVLITVGVLCASGYGSTLLFKNLCVPRLKTWVRKVVAEENVLEKDGKQHSAILERTAEAAKTAAEAATVVATASEQLLSSKNEERKFYEAIMDKMDLQVKEMKSVGEAVRKLDCTKENGSTIFPPKNYQQSQINGKSNPDHTAVRPSSSPAAMEPTTAPHPKSYMEIIAMIQRGERPSNIREINDMPPNPNQQPSKPALAPRPKPWELSQSNTEEGNGEDQSEPWWKKKTASTLEMVSDSSNISGLSTPSQRVWVPPQPPTVTIPEAAAAIRHPKKYPSADTANSNNEDGMDSETNIESNGSKLEGSEISVEPVIEDTSEKEEQANVELDKSGYEIEQVKDDGVEIG